MFAFLRKLRCLPALISFLSVALGLVCAAPGRAGEKHAEEPEAVLKGLKLPLGFKAELWTAPKQVLNPVAIDFDDQNRMYVAETFRFRLGGGLDIRENKFMYYDDIMSLTVADRAKMYEKYKDKFKPGYFTQNKEKILLLEDTAHSGKADKTTVFAEAFNEAVDGPGVGIAYFDGKVYYTSIPKLWELTGANGMGPAQKINSLVDGFGVRVGISGHDLHGVVVGPDEKLYWSIGDRGYNLTGKEGQRFSNPHSGGVFRCNLDGSGLELYYSGLRNPQELAFDEFGNFFTCDNNADIGDAARFTYILEGGSSGWHMGWQELGLADFAKAAGLGGKRPNPWMDEGLWKERFEQQPAWMLPPVGLITSGPCGLAYNPGTGIPDSYAKHFFVCDYTSGSNSGVHSCTAEADGAGYKLKNKEKFLWGVTATDVAFGYDGRMYVCDYGGGWGLPLKGAIIALWEPEALKNPRVEEVRKLFADGIGKLGTKELATLLKHADQRVRQRAQFELVKHGADGLAALSAAATTPGEVLPRVHGIWGLGQLAGKNPQVFGTLISLMGDSDERVREQAVKMLSDARHAPALDKLLPLLKDSSPRVKTFAAIALGKMQCKTDIAELIEILRANADKDAFLRHGAIMGLAGADDAKLLTQYVADSSRAVRLGVLEALRRLKAGEIAVFLHDSDPLIYAEALRAIYEVPIPGALPQMIEEIKRVVAKPDEFKTLSSLNFLRILNAAYRYGSAANAASIAEFAASTGVPEPVRIEALELLQRWDDPTVCDPVTGFPRPVPKRDKLVPDEAIKAAIGRLMSEDGAISARATGMAVSFGVELKDDLLLSILKNDKRGELLRVAAVQQLQQRKNAALTALLPQLVGEQNTKVRVAALTAQLELDPAAGVASARTLLNDSAPAKSGVQVVTDKTTLDWERLTMGAPSKIDYADKHSGHGVAATYVKGFGTPIEKAGPDGFKLPRLIDGEAAQNEDDTERNTWIDGNEARYLLDLQKAIQVGTVNTFSWHVKNRAPQKFTLWGSNKPNANAAAKDLKGEWTKLADVDTTPLKDGGKHGSTIYNSAGSLGEFRYLLWQNASIKYGTFFTELDVYEQGQWSFTPLAQRRLQQEVFQVLGKTATPLAAGVLQEWLDKMAAGKVPPVLHLDLIEAAEARKEDALVKRMADFHKGFSDDDKLSSFRDAMVGGDSKCGEEVFQFHAAGCLKCHRLDDSHSGSDAGPKLSGVGTRLTREKILESLIDPSAVIVPGFGNYSFKLEDGRVISGSIIEENAKEVTVKDADGKTLKLQVSEIKKRSQPVSPMPPMGPVLKPREIRDLIEYLSTLK